MDTIHVITEIKYIAGTIDKKLYSDCNVPKDHNGLWQPLGWISGAKTK